MKPVPPSQRSAAPHGRLTSFLAALLMTMHVTGAPLLGADTGDFKVGEVVEYRIGDTAPFMMKITRIDAGGIYAEFVDSGVALGQYCEAAALRRTKAVPPPPAVPAGKGVMTEAEFFQLLEARLGEGPPVDTEREKVFTEMEALIKLRGVNFRVVPLSETRKRLYALKIRGTVAATLHDNFGPPGLRAGLLGTWAVNKLAAAVDFDKDGKRFRDNEFGAGGAGALTLNANNTYSWRVPPVAAVEGTWRAATAAEMQARGGDGIVLLKAKAGWDWIVVKDRITVPEGDRILISELTSGKVKEYGRK